MNLANKLGLTLVLSAVVSACAGDKKRDFDWEILSNQHHLVFLNSYDMQNDTNLNPEIWVKILKPSGTMMIQHQMRYQLDCTNIKYAIKETKVFDDMGDLTRHEQTDNAALQTAPLDTQVRAILEHACPKGGQ